MLISMSLHKKGPALLQNDVQTCLGITDNGVTRVRLKIY